MVTFNKLNFVRVYLASIIGSCVNHPSAAGKVVKTLYSLYTLTMVNLPPVFVHRQDRIATKVAYV